MPRPPVKRRRPNPPKSQVPSYPSKNGLAAREELDRKLVKKKIAKTNSFESDDSDGLVTRPRPNTARRQREATIQTIYASGGVKKGDKPGAYPSTAERRAKLRRDTTTIIRANSTASSNSRLSSREPPSEPESSGLRTIPNMTPSKSIIKNASAEAVAPGTQMKSTEPELVATPLSVLGKIKPRKRQPSILRQLESSDLSSIGSDDEDQFLADNESKLSNGSRPTNQDSSTISSSRKRKRTGTPLEPVSNAVEDSVEDSIVLPTDSASNLLASSARSSVGPPEPELPPLPTSRPHKFFETNQTDEADEAIMALPHSSSSQSSADEEPAPQIVKQNKRRDKKTARSGPPSTEELQKQMPSKPQRPTRHNVRMNRDFESPLPDPYPLDSSSDESDNVSAEDLSGFIPSKGSRKGKTAQRKPAPKVRAIKGISKSITNGIGKNKSTSTRTTLSTSTPLSLSRSDKRNRAIAKSPSLQRGLPSPDKTKSSLNSNVTSLNPAPTPVPGIACKAAKSFGGYRRSQRIMPGKENITFLAASTDKFTDADTNTILEVDHGFNEVNGQDGGVDIPLKTLDTVRDRWAEVDNWDLEFEDVSVPTRSSSPMRR